MTSNEFLRQGRTPLVAVLCLAGAASLLVACASSSGGTRATGTPAASAVAGEPTSSAEGTPPTRRGTGRPTTTATIATILNVPEGQLRTELAAPGATFAKVAAAHGVARAQLSEMYIAAIKEMLDAEVRRGTRTRADADQGLEIIRGIVDVILDSNGMAPPGT